MPVIDLTHTFSIPMPLYPGDPEPSLTKVRESALGDCVDHLLHTTMHIGTHMDAPLHMIKDGKYVSDIPVDACIGPGAVIDARGKETLDVSLLDDLSIAPGSILLVCTGHGSLFRSPGYYDHYPLFTDSFAEKAVKMGIKMLGMDTPSPDAPPFSVHKLLLSKNILILENLTNLEQLIGITHFTVAALPMKLKADAAPVRVVAMTE